MGESSWRARDEWVGSQVEDLFVMINLDHGKYVSLNATANHVWQMLATPHTENEIIASLVETFEVDEDKARESVGRLLEDLENKNLIARAN
jgi:hypothetical protein